MRSLLGQKVKKDKAAHEKETAAQEKCEQCSSRKEKAKKEKRKLRKGEASRLKNMIKVAWQRHGFEVLKMNREGIKVGGKRLKGVGTELNRFHFNIRPRDSDLAHAAYPHLLDIKVHGTTQWLDYTMFEHPDLTGMVCVKYCHRQTQAMKNLHPLLFQKICLLRRIRLLS